jgi:hypothetical protein
MVPSYQEIVFHRDGQLFVYSTPEGRPDTTPTPTVAVFDGDVEVAATQGTCRIDQISTTLSDEATRGATVIFVDAPSAMRPGRYQIGQGHDRETIEVRSVAGTRVSLARPIVERYRRGTLVGGMGIAVEVALPWAYNRQNLSNAPARQASGFLGYRLEWTFHIDGFEHHGTSHVDLVRDYERATCLVTALDVERRAPDWLAGVPAGHRTPFAEMFIAEAFTAVRLDAAANDRTRLRIRDATVLRELVIIRASLIALEDEVMKGVRDTADLVIAEAHYRTRSAQLLDPVPLPRLRRPSSGELTRGSGIRRLPPKLTRS